MVSIDRGFSLLDLLHKVELKQLEVVWALLSLYRVFNSNLIDQCVFGGIRLLNILAALILLVLSQYFTMITIVVNDNHK